MRIDADITLNMLGTVSQNGSQANSQPDLSSTTNSLTANNQANSQAKVNQLSNQKQDTGNTDASSEAAPPSGLVGSLALDDDKNVVVRFYDDKGNMVAQCPPESYIKQMKELNQMIKNLFHTTA